MEQIDRKQLTQDQANAYLGRFKMALEAIAKAEYSIQDPTNSFYYVIRIAKTALQISEDSTQPQGDR